MTVGAGVPEPLTATVTFDDEEPPTPEQLNVNSVVVGSTPVDADPDVAFAPAHPFKPSEAVQALAFADDQLSVAVPPVVTVIGVAEIVTVGAGTTVTVLVADAVPPPPVQLSEKSAVIAILLIDSVPLVALLPVQPPLAVQPLASVELQMRELCEPLAIDVGDALRLTVGAGGFIAAFSPVEEEQAAISAASARSNRGPDAANTRRPTIVDVVNITRFTQEPFPIACHS